MNENKTDQQQFIPDIMIKVDIQAESKTGKATWQTIKNVDELAVVHFLSDVIKGLINDYNKNKKGTVKIKKELYPGKTTNSTGEKVSEN